jgi:hypothetical protein
MAVLPGVRAKPWVGEGSNSKVYIIHINKQLVNILGVVWEDVMKPQRSEILSRMIRFLNLDSDGLRRTVLESIVEAREFTVASLHECVSSRFNVSRKTIASMIGYICSSLGILHVNKKSYRTPKTYVLRDEYADIARAVLATL